VAYRSIALNLRSALMKARLRAVFLGRIRICLFFRHGASPSLSLAACAEASRARWKNARSSALIWSLSVEQCREARRHDFEGRALTSNTLL
jgi:hypothetical protein